MRISTRTYKHSLIHTRTHTSSTITMDVDNYYYDDDVYTGVLTDFIIRICCVFIVCVRDVTGYGIHTNTRVRSCTIRPSRVYYGYTYTHVHVRTYVYLCVYIVSKSYCAHGLPTGTYIILRTQVGGIRVNVPTGIPGINRGRYRAVNGHEARQRVVHVR